MKNVVFPAILLAGTLFFHGCGQKEGDKDERIATLEQKISQLEQNQVATPANVQSAEPADPAASGEFQFEEMEYDFGTIEEGEVIDHVFTFTNTGQAPLVISSVQASCGCTSPDWTKTPIKPGEEGFVKVNFNSTAKSGIQSPTVTIQANTTPNVTRLRLKGNVNQKTTASSPALGPVKK